MTVADNGKYVSTPDGALDGQYVLSQTNTPSLSNMGNLVIRHDINVPSCFDSDEEPTELNNKFDIWAIVRFPNGVAQCIGKKVVDDGAGNKEWVADWVKSYVNAPPSAPTLGNILIKNNDGSQFMVAPANGQLIQNLGKNLIATANASNSMNLETLANPTVLHINSGTGPDSIIEYTPDQEWINFNVDGGTLTKVNDNTFLLTVTAGTLDPSALYAISLDNLESVTAVNNSITHKGGVDSGLETKRTGDSAYVTSVVAGRIIPRSYLPNQSYDKHEVVYYGGQLYICMLAGVATDLTPTQPTFYNIFAQFISGLTDSIGTVLRANTDGNVLISSKNEHTAIVKIDPMLEAMEINVTAVAKILDQNLVDAGKTESSGVIFRGLNGINVVKSSNPLERGVIDIIGDDSIGGTANIHIVNEDGSPSFDVYPDAYGQINMTFDSLLRAIQDEANGWKLKNLATTTIAINNEPDELVSYTDTLRYIGIKAGAGISLTKDPLESNVFTIESYSAPSPDANAVYTLVANTGSASAVTHAINVVGNKVDGIDTNAVEDTDTLEISIVATRNVPYKYATEQTYILGDLVFFNQQAYVALKNVTTGAGDFTPDLTKFAPVRLFQRGVQSSVTGNPIYPNADGLIINTSTSPSTLTISDAPNGQNFNVDAVQSIAGSDGNIIPKDPNNKYKFILEGGSVLSTGELGVVSFNLPESTSVKSLSGDDAGIAIPSNGDIKLSSSNAKLAISCPLNIDNNNVNFTIAPLVNKIVGDNLSAPIVPDANDQIQLASKDVARLAIDRKAGSVNVLEFELKNTFDGIEDQNGVRLEKNAFNNTQISIGSETDITFTQSIVVGEEYKGIIKQTANPIKKIVAQDATEASPTAYDQGSHLTVVGEQPQEGEIAITTRAEGNTLFIKGSGAFQNYVATGVIGSMPNPLFDQSTLTLTIFAGQGIIYNGGDNTYNLVSWNQQTTTISATDPTTHIYINGAGAIYTTNAYTPVDIRTYIRIGYVTLDVASPLTTAYFNPQPTSTTDSSTLLDLMLAIGMIVVGVNYTGAGLILSKNSTITPTVATLNVTGGRFMFYAINSQESGYVNKNFTYPYPATTSFRMNYYYRNASGAFVQLAGYQDVQNLLLTSYAPNGVITPITNNRWSASAIYFVRNFANILNSQFVIVLSPYQDTTQSEAMQKIQDFVITTPLVLAGVSTQQIKLLGVTTWAHTNSSDTDFLHVTNATQGGLLLGGGGGGEGSLSSNDVTKKNPISPIVPLLNIVGGSISVGAGQGYVLGKSIAWDQTLLAGGGTSSTNTTFWAVYSTDAGVVSQVQILTSSDLTTLYTNTCPLFTYWSNSVNFVHNVSTFQSGIFYNELSGDAILKAKAEIYTTSSKNTVTQTSPATLLNVALAEIPAFTHLVFKKTFDVSSQIGIPRFQFSGTDSKIAYIIPNDGLWRMSIVFMCNCETLPPVLLNTMVNLNAQDDQIEHIHEVANEVICYDKHYTPITKNLRVLGSNTGYFYELFPTTVGYVNSADAKYNTNTSYNNIYVGLIDSFAIKYCLYLGNELIRTYETDISGRAKGGYMAFRDPNGAFSVCI